jgi:hypothetical protein
MTNAGYSGTPQAKKLGIKPGLTLSVVNRPQSWEFAALPDGVESVETGPADVILAFVTSATQLATCFDTLPERIFPAAALWFAWPRKAAGHVSDVDENLIRNTALERGLVDVKVAAIDTDWSGLKVVWRVENRVR